MIKFLKRTFALMLLLSVVSLMNIHICYAISPSATPEYDGIDVSNWQGNIDFRRVKEAGIDVVYIKASEGTTYRDPYFERNYNNAKANGLKVGFYHFLTATNVEQARRQAQFFASVISGKSPDCKLAMDFERFSNGITNEEINQISEVFLQTLKDLTQKDVIIYSNLYDSQRVFNNQLASKYPLWLAYYGDYTRLTNTASNWSSWAGVQYTSRGTVAGIDGYVDRNKFTQNIFLGECTNCPEVEKPEPSDDTTENATIEYTVKRGDTLWSIAQRYGTTVQSLVEENGIQNPRLIYPGQIIKITNESMETNEMGHCVYTVKRGDTLWSIARAHNTTVQSIASLNKIQNPNLIYPGQKLRIEISSNNTADRVTYTVKKGDSLWKIARMYGTSVGYLATLNGIENTRLIYPGQVIVIMK